MFTGIITALGTVREIRSPGGGDDMRLVIETPWPGTASIAIGASIACSGCCLTAVEVSADSFAVDASAETLACTTLGGWVAGTRVNLERSLRIGDELGGHMVSGHADGVGEALSGDSGKWFDAVALQGAQELARFIAAKGSVAVNGVSLTVNDVRDDTFGVNVIPHTSSVTGFGIMTPGDKVNIEIDMLARYVARLAETT